MLCFFFFNDTATTEIYTLSLHDALPISLAALPLGEQGVILCAEDGRQVGEDLIELLAVRTRGQCRVLGALRSEEHTSELQSRQYLVCRLLLEKKKKNQTQHFNV